MEYSSRPVWRSQLGLILVLVIFLITAMGMSASPEEGVAFWWIVSGLIFLIILYRHFAWFYQISDGQIESKKGIISRNIKNIRVQDLRNVNYKQSILGRLLKYGNVQFSSAGGGGIEVEFYRISNPRELKERVQDELDTQQ